MNKMTAKPILTALSCALLMAASSSSASATTLLAEDFNDVTFIGTNTVRNVNAITSSANPSIRNQLPAGTTWQSSNAVNANVNIRTSTNDINTTGKNAATPAAVQGFNNFFNSNFLVLGDNGGAIGGDPTSGNMSISLPFIVGNGGSAVDISFDYSFYGQRRNPALFDVDFFIISIINEVTGATAWNSTILFSQPGDPDLFGPFSDITYLNQGSYFLTFELDESDLQNANGAQLINSAVGVDSIQISTVPEPSTLILVGLGLAGAALVRKKRS